MTTRPAGHDHDQLLELLEICEEFLGRTSPGTHNEVDTLLRERGITGGPGWLIDMLGLARLRLQHQHNNSELNTRNDA